MTDLQALFKTIEELPREELERVGQFVEQRKRQISPIQLRINEDVETRIAALHTALAEFREGLTEGELEELLLAMSTKFALPMKNLGLFDWIDDLPEHER